MFWFQAIRYMDILLEKSFSGHFFRRMMRSMIRGFLHSFPNA